ncbi:MAG: SDR family oxidoreductase [Eubacteriales bacterium]|nr:SDR family oxidoreductase [Eubacteriales bacterium]
MKKLLNKIALITGGTSGIGLEIKNKFIEEGAKVIAIGRKDYDITNEDNIKSLFEKIKNDYGTLDILINNAGVYISKDLQNIEEKDFYDTYNINVKAPILICKYFLPLLKSSKGVIINNASIAGLNSFVDGKASYIYASSKAALIQFSNILAKNVSSDVRVNCIAPGIVDTNIYTNKDFSRFEEKIPIGRIANAKDIANLVLFLVSDEASYITGATIPIDGGMSLG